jgi:hypothetical protein
VDGCVLSKGASGLNGSNFASIVFLQAGTRLIPLESWEERPEDRQWPPDRLDLLIRTYAPTGQIEAVRMEIGCARIRPEGVAGACPEEDRPASFARCRDNGWAIWHFLDHAAARPGSGRPDDGGGSISSVRIARWPSGGTRTEVFGRV